MEEDDGKSNTIKIYNPTYLLKPRPDTKFIKRNVEAKMTEILEAKTKDVKYEAEEMAALGCFWVSVEIWVHQNMACIHILMYANGQRQMQRCIGDQYKPVNVLFF